MNLIKLNATDSTNTYLKQLARKTTVPDGTVVLTENQLKGRGQMGNGWISKPGESLTFSMFKRFQGLEGEQQFGISMAVSLAIADTLTLLDVPEVAIKWPNDILSVNKKIAGILIENVLEGSFIKHAVIGIGVNVNENSFKNLSQASSLKLQVGTSFQRDKVLDAIVKSIHSALMNLPSPDMSSLKTAYEKKMFRKEKMSLFETTEGGRFYGIIKGISNLGMLVIDTDGEGVREFDLKQVKLIY